MQLSFELRSRLKLLPFAQQEALCNQLHRKAVSQNNDLSPEDLAYLLFLAEDSLWPSRVTNTTQRWRESERDYTSRVKCIRAEMGLSGDSDPHNKTNEQRLSELLSVRSLTKLLEAQSTQSATV